MTNLVIFFLLPYLTQHSDVATVCDTYFIGNGCWSSDNEPEHSCSWRRGAGDLHV